MSFSIVHTILHQNQKKERFHLIREYSWAEYSSTISSSDKIIYHAHRCHWNKPMNSSKNINFRWNTKIEWNASRRWQQNWIAKFVAENQKSSLHFQTFPLEANHIRCVCCETAYVVCINSKCNLYSIETRMWRRKCKRTKKIWLKIESKWYRYCLLRFECSRFFGEGKSATAPVTISNDFRGQWHSVCRNAFCRFCGFRFLASKHRRWPYTRFSQTTLCINILTHTSEPNAHKISCGWNADRVRKKKEWSNRRGGKM